MLDELYDALRINPLTKKTGRVVASGGLSVTVEALDAFVGEQCLIRTRGDREALAAEVVSLEGDRVIVMPFGDLKGIRVGDEVSALGKPFTVAVGDKFLGRVIDVFGNPLDGKGKVVTREEYPVYGSGINPMLRPPIEKLLQTGVRAIDGLLTMGHGQRVGIFAGSGVGKSTLLGMICRNTEADINVVALVGERGREVREFVEGVLGKEGLKRSVVFVATPEQSPLVRTHTAFAATAMAEYFRDKGKSVVLTMDSLTRFAMAQREIGLAIGEPPTSRGYTPSVFAALARLLERAGTHEGVGAITGLYTVLVEADDMLDPIGDSVRAIVDGHVVLSRELANEGHFPAIDVLESNSRLVQVLQSAERNSRRMKFVKVLSGFARARDMVELGIYKKGANAEIDALIETRPLVESYLCQKPHERVTLNDGLKSMDSVIDAVERHAN